MSENNTQPAQSGDNGEDLVKDVSKAPLPTEHVLKRRHNLGYQFGRFVAFDLRIMRMVFKGHH